MKRKRYKKAEQISRELMKIFNRNGGKAPWTGEQFIAFNLWEVLGIVKCMAREFLDNPTIEGWQRTKDWMLDDHHFYCLKNFKPKTKREADRLVKNGTAWMMRISLEDVADRIEILEEYGE
ncbi:MAG: hypothetical protein WCI27_05405 [Candidatus Omnitrophota bacterium]